MLITNASPTSTESVVANGSTFRRRSSSARNTQNRGDQWFDQLAAVSMGVFSFGGFFPQHLDNDFTRQALIKTSYLYRKYLHREGLRVSVENGVVHLYGQVTSGLIVKIGERLAKQIEGVEDICDETQKIESDTSLEDRELEARIRFLLTSDQSLNNQEIKAEVREGQILLQGSVKSEENRLWLEELTANLLGASGQVQLEVSVQAPENPVSPTLRRIDDDSLHAMVGSRLKMIRPTRNLDLEVTGAHQKVILRGEVDEEDRKNLAEKVARKTIGVRQFACQLSVSLMAADF